MQNFLIAWKLIHWEFFFFLSIIKTKQKKNHLKVLTLGTHSKKLKQNINTGCTRFPKCFQVISN